MGAFVKIMEGYPTVTVRSTLLGDSGDVFGDVGFTLLFLDLPLSEDTKYAGIFAVKSDRKKG